MKHRPRNRYLALAAGQRTAVPPPGKRWSENELREIRIERARDCERYWAAQREALLECHPGVVPWRLAQSDRRFRELDEALLAVRERLVELEATDGPAE